MRVVVTPRACAAPDGEPLPFHHHVRRIAARNKAGLINLFGEVGTGKSTALHHLAAVFAPAPGITLLDEDADPTTAPATTRIVVLATRRRMARPHLAAFRMAPWTRDDVIEYLLATRPDRCASVMARLKDAPDGVGLGGVPELWAVVLEQMLADETIATPAEALRHFLAARLGDDALPRKVTDHCLRLLFRGFDPETADTSALPDWFDRVDPAVARLIRHPPVQLLLAAQRIVWDIAGGRGRGHLHRPLPGELMREVAALAAFREPALNELRWVVQDRRDRLAQPAAASLLHATGTRWKPEGNKPCLTGARLDGAAWAGVDLAGAELSAAHLCGAQLDTARLDDANVQAADLTGASLRGASLRKLRALNAVLRDAALAAANAAGADFGSADLSGADLSAADLTEALFVNADLSGASLRGATLCGACLHLTRVGGADLSAADLGRARITEIDLRDVNLAGASFCGARLLGCDLQDVQTPDAQFESAVLSECDFAGSVLPRADFRGARLDRAGLAFVSWEGADLRDADFTGASFHTGSSRSGLVGSTLASEGTRTGFYTDDYDDRTHKPPEDIRKASLCGADLRGAKVDETDFYLVDLRGARYTPSQARHFRRSGAIL